MIHDFVLSLLTPNVDTLPIAAFLNSKESQLYMHPWEHKVLENIVKIAVQHQDIRNFVQLYSTQQALCTAANGGVLLDTSGYAIEPLQKGLYLQAFCEGIDHVLLPFRDSIADLERRYLQTPTHSLMFVYERIKSFQPLFAFLLGFIEGVRAQRLHGCALLKYLHQHSLHGNRTIAEAIETVQVSVHRVFLKQLTQWVMHGRFVDVHDEFFIQLIEQPPAVGTAALNTTANTSLSGGDAAFRSSTGAARGASAAAAAAATAAGHHHSAGAAHNSDLWRYEIGYDQLPPYFTPQWAEKVRFIGQTVVTFNLDPNCGGDGGASGDVPDDSYDARSPDPLASGTAAAHQRRADVQLAGRTNPELGAIDQRQRTLWNEREYVYVRQLRAICDGDRLHLDLYEPVIDAIKVYVSERLSEIAIKQADLVRQLRLIKDFFLLGRGEFYLEFIKQTRAVLLADNDGRGAASAAPVVIDEATAKAITTAFATAAHNINVVDDLEQFQLTVQLDGHDTATGGGNSLDTSLAVDGASTDAAVAAAAAAAVGFIPSIALRYRVRWPLHLLFAPRIIDGYNEMFRFLLQIKRVQYLLQMVWFDHRERRIGRDSRVVQLRNKLMFVVNNLQYYLQVDVLEAQFSVLMQTVQESRDFEHIQRAHTVFQANVLSLCFLLQQPQQQHQHHQSTHHHQQQQQQMMGSVTMAAHMLNRSDVFGSADNPVLIILNKIMQRVLIFCKFSMGCGRSLTGDEQRTLGHSDEIFEGHVAELMRLLSGMQAGPSSAPLAQLLLRLDYNYFFSAKEVQRLSAALSVEEDESIDGGDDDEEE